MFRSYNYRETAFKLFGLKSNTLVKNLKSVVLKGSSSEIIKLWIIEIFTHYGLEKSFATLAMNDLTSFALVTYEVPVSDIYVEEIKNDYLKLLKLLVLIFYQHQHRLPAILIQI